jgi:hypothetical protein
MVVNKGLAVTLTKAEALYMLILQVVRKIHVTMVTDLVAKFQRCVFKLLIIPSSLFTLTLIGSLGSLFSYEENKNVKSPICLPDV